MTPKEKAKELTDKYAYMCLYSTSAFDNIKGSEAKPFIKQCALIAVDEIIKAIDWHEFDVPNEELNYWQEVKQEIEKL